MPSILRTTGAPINRMKKGSIGGEGSAAAAAASRRSLRVGMLAARPRWGRGQARVLEKFGEASSERFICVRFGGKAIRFKGDGTSHENTGANTLLPSSAPRPGTPYTEPPRPPL
eukprot:scaffold38804_cov63-Phaeocystis_antarctica.AAC.3